MSDKKGSATKAPVKKSDLISKQYQIKDGKIERKRPFCNRCGRGYFMADHGNRYTCGNCGFTIFKTKTD
jgi:small subunit ribosomal protein S27Ae